MMISLNCQTRIDKFPKIEDFLKSKPYLIKQVKQQKINLVKMFLIGWKIMMKKLCQNIPLKNIII